MLACTHATGATPARHPSKAAVCTSSDAQASLAVSLEAMRAQVDSQAAVNKARERAMYLKV
jgi:hypothetical protein